LSESGVPTPVVHTRMTPPASRMRPADDVEGKAKASPLWAKYGERVDNESAREMLAARMETPAASAPAPADDGDTQARPAPTESHKKAAGAAAGGVATVTAFLQSKQGKQLEKQVMRGVFGLLKKKL